jgi:hypothetical protein
MTTSPDPAHVFNVASLAEDLAAVLADAGCDADTARALDGHAWHLADAEVRRRRGKPHKGHHYHTPGQPTRDTTILLLERPRP